MMNKLITLLFLFLSFSIQKGLAQQIDLAGQWKFSLDAKDQGVKGKWFNQTLDQTIKLPGTTDDAGFGIPNILEPKLEKPQLQHLTRKNSYVGVAWYSKDVIIPQTWLDKNIILKLERVIWNTIVWVDGKQSTSNESLISPHYFDLSNLLPAGKHTFVIRIDNRKQHEMSENNLAHSYTNETQIIWNGVIGDIFLEATDPVKLASIKIFPDIDNKKIKVDVLIENHTSSIASGNLTIQAISKKDNKALKTVVFKLNDIDANKTVSLEYPMGNDFKQWDEFSPNLYDLIITLQGDKFSSKKSTQFGMRKLTGMNSLLQINNRRLFLRGTLECCVFPLTGRPPMKKEEWLTVFKHARDWGLNHLRFHSWCPPEAAFAAADEAGFYLQVELPLWDHRVGHDSLTMRFLKNEAQNIIREYGNHPSFCFWSMGNELLGDYDQLISLVMLLKKQDPRHLYTSSSAPAQKTYQFWPAVKCDDYYITALTKKGWARGQGIFNSESPSFNKDYSSALDSMPLPIITHEIGQYSVYPNMEEIKKYTGVLTPLNFIAIHKDLERKGLIGKAGDYLMASGKLAAILYKEEIERAMKTPGLSGFQLLDLHDFPGQGSALVGLLDAFWDSKGLITAGEFRQFCAPVVPLIRYPKAVYENTETFEATTEVANYGNEPLKSKTISWQIKDKTGKALATGRFNTTLLTIGNNRIPGKILFPLKGIKTASQLSISLRINGTIYENKWKIWVYPKTEAMVGNDVITTQSFEQATKELQAGKNVLLTPDWKKLKGIEGKFVPVFWSPVFFPQAGTMGILCNPAHPAFSLFPTEANSDWQWWNLCKNSKTMIIDSLKGVTPLVEMVDNFANNRRLASVFEVKTGKGKLIFSSIDLFNDLEKRPVARQLRNSLIHYMNSPAFNPSDSLSLQKIQSVLSEMPG